jgi:hypothetical protein
MRIERARVPAERLHADDCEEDGTALLENIRRVARRVEADLQVVAWLYESGPRSPNTNCSARASTAKSCARYGSCIARPTRARTASTSSTET